ncbi:MAG: HEAT repeat domain-containing protein [Pseudomonadota bacterium]
MQKTIRITTFAALIWAILLVPQVASAKTNREKIELLLSGIEYVPSKEALMQLGTDIDGVLRDIVAKPSARRLARTRALTALRWFPSKATEDLLHSVILANSKAKKGLALLNLGKALCSYAVIAGPKSLKISLPFLSHPSPELRYRSARAVLLSKSPDARAILVKLLEKEPSAMVRHQIKKQIMETTEPSTQK